MLTEAQISEAIEQVKTHCDGLQEDYTPVSMRSALYDLGYEADADQIIRYVASAGFDYCLDPMITSERWDMQYEKLVKVRPSEDVCYWGPDQLKSRLNSLR